MDEQLEQLVTQAQEYARQNEERQLVLAQLADEILRSRKICRQLANKPLFGIYTEIFEQVRQQLLHDVDEQINQYNPKQTTVRTWINNLRNQAFKKILDDTQLKKLALEAQRHPPHTELRQYALRELVEAIRLSGRLCHPHRESYSLQIYELIYDEAVNETLIYVCQKIDNYDPERGDKKFMNWVNFRLDKVLMQVYKELQQPNIINLHNISDLELINPSKEPNYLGEDIRNMLQEDSDNVFKTTHIRNRPDANFVAIALARLSGKSWQQIAAEFSIPLPTLSSFFQRSCEKFRSKFEQYM